MKKIGNILFLYFFVFVMCMGASFAWYVWKGDDVSVSVNFADLDPYIKYTPLTIKDSDKNKTLTESNDYTGGRCYNLEFNKNANGDNLEVYGQNYLKVSSVTNSNIFKASNLKWTLVSVTGNTKTEISSGNFVGEDIVSDNDISKMIPASIDFSLTKDSDNTNYEFCLWLDSNSHQNVDISGEDITVSIVSEASTTNNINEMYIRSIEYEVGVIKKFTVYSSKNIISAYKIINTETTPSSSYSDWITISSNEDASIESGKVVTITPNYTMNTINNICIKDSENNIYCKSIGKYSDEIDRPTNALCKSGLKYNGVEQQLVESTSGVGYTLSDDDYNQTNANEDGYTITATLKDNYSWKTADSNDSYNAPSTFKCSIAAYDLSNATIASVSNQEYTGSEIKPAPVVTVPLPSGSTTTLVSVTDFTYSYSNNKNAGEATITVTGKGNYKGTKSTNFKISYKTYNITLDNQSATTSGTTTLYGRYADGIYLDSSYSKKMTTSSNNITIPTKTGYTFLGYYTATNGEGTQLINASGNVTSSFTSTLYNSNTTLYAYWKDKTAPTCNSISGGTSLKSTSQTLTASCSDGVGVTGYYWSKDSTTVPTTSSTWSTSKTYSATAAGTYRLWARDAAGNISNAVSVTIVSYTVNNLLEKVDGTTGTYTSANYASASSSSYIVKSGTSLTLASIYAVPTGSSASNFKGYSTSFSTSAASLSTTAPSASNTTYYMWFNRNTFALTLNNGNTAAISSVSGAGTYKYGKSVSISATLNNGYTFNGWTVNLGNTPTSTSSASTTISITQKTTLTANAIDNTAPTCSISGGTSLKSTSQTLTASCSDGVGVTGYYWSKNSSTAPTSSSTWTTNKTYSVSVNDINKYSSYRLWAKDAAGNISSVASIRIVKYNVNNLLENVNGTTDTYTSENYTSVSSTATSYIVQEGTTLTLADIYTAPTKSSFKGYSTSFSTSAASLSTTAPTVTAGTSIITYYMWFNRNTFTLNVKAYASVLDVYCRFNESSTWKLCGGWDSETKNTGVKYNSTYYYYATPVDNNYYMESCSSESSSCSGTMTGDATITVSGTRKSTNTLIVSARSLTYNGSAQSLVTASSAQGTVYYAVGTQLTSSNYSSSGSTTIPTRTNAGTYTVYYYTPGNITYLSKSGSVSVTIANPANGWVGDKYYVNGVAAIGWKQINDNYYYFDSYGNKITSKWIYTTTSDSTGGACASSCSYNSSNFWYYLNSTGIRVVGNEGANTTGTTISTKANSMASYIDSRYYSFTTDGRLFYGYTYISGGLWVYYTNASVDNSNWTSNSISGWRSSQSYTAQYESYAIGQSDHALIAAGHNIVSGGSTTNKIQVYDTNSFTDSSYNHLWYLAQGKTWISEHGSNIRCKYSQNNSYSYYSTDTDYVCP